MKIKNLLIAAAFIAVSSTAAHAVTITKSPDRGTYWQPLNPASGTYVYANSFVATDTGIVSALGTWLDTMTFDASTEMVFHVLGSVAGDVAQGPSMSAILATSNAIIGMNGGLTYYSAGMDSSSVLTSGETYWFAASVIGSAGNGRYAVGGHTQNSEGIVDNGTFWYSNNPAGSYFDGRGYTPEMAFTVEIEGGNRVPDSSSTLALLGMALCSAVVLRRKMA